MPTDPNDLSSQTAPLKTELTDLQGLADGFGRAMTNAFRRSVVDGKKFEDVLKSLALGLSSRALSQALAPIGQGIGNALSGVLGNLFNGLGFAKGGVYRAARDALCGRWCRREPELSSRCRAGPRMWIGACRRGGARGDPAADAERRRDVSACARKVAAASTSPST